MKINKNILTSFLFLILVFTIHTTFAQQAGTLDEFLNTEEANDGVNTLALQEDGKILIGGFFTSYNGVSRRRIARLNPDGSLDQSFNPGGGANFSVNTLALQGDGKILVGGFFTSYNGVLRNNIARLNPDGSLDQSFNPGGGASFSVNTLALQGDGKILVGGFFTSYNGVLRNNIARLNPDGSLDESFNPRGGANGSVSTVALQGDGKILIGGSFTEYNGALRNRITRLNPDGSLDQSFNPRAGAEASSFTSVETLSLQGDGKILIGGSFTSYNGALRNRIARLNPDGSLDQSFNPESGANFSVLTVAFQGDGKILIGGSFTSYNGALRNRIARLNLDGSLDQSFNPEGGANSNVLTVSLQGDGKILIGGFFTSYNGALRNRIARLNLDGSLDQSFNPESGANGSVRALALQGDGKILIGGSFTSYNGVSRRRIARLNPDGSLDQSFNPEPGANDRVYTLALQGDGKILMGGSFTSYNGALRNRIARLNPDGSLDQSFNPESGASDDVFTLSLQGDGKILIGGFFTSYDGVERNHIARLNPDGSLDQSFNPESGASGDVETLALQGDGKILIGGLFRSYNGVERNNIARLNPDGSLDRTFNPGAGANIEVSTLALQEDEKILIGGSFTSYNGALRNRIARLNPDGSLDQSFNPGAGANSIVRALALQPNGRILMGGDLTSYDGTARGRIARVYGSVPFIPENLKDTLNTDSSFVLTWDRVPGIEEYEVAVSDDAFFSTLPGYENRFVRDTSLLIEGLEVGEQYSCVVRSINEQGASPNSARYDVQIAPLAPTNLQAQGRDRSILLTWAADRLSNTVYLIEFSEGNTDNFRFLTFLTGNRLEHSDLRPGQTYYYRVQASIPEGGGTSAYSTIVGATTLPDIVTSLSPSVSESLKLYPNPSQDMLYLNWQGAESEPQFIQILDVFGRLIREEKLDFKNKQAQISIQGLVPGLYQLRIRNGQGQIIQKFMKP